MGGGPWGSARVPPTSHLEPSVCPSKPDVETRLVVDDRAAAQARHFLLQSSCTEHHTAVLETSMLLVSELATNAVRHGAPPVTVRLHCDEVEGLEIRVSDGSSRAPLLRRPDPGRWGGRGVVLVDTLSQEWGVVPTRTGKVVWCRLRSA